MVSPAWASRSSHQKEMTFELEQGHRRRMELKAFQAGELAKPLKSDVNARFIISEDLLWARHCSKHSFIWFSQQPYKVSAFICIGYEKSGPERPDPAPSISETVPTHTAGIPVCLWVLVLQQLDGTSNLMEHLEAMGSIGSLVWLRHSLYEGIWKEPKVEREFGGSSQSPSLYSDQWRQEEQSSTWFLAIMKARKQKAQYWETFIHCRDVWSNYTYRWKILNYLVLEYWF